MTDLFPFIFAFFMGLLSAFSPCVLPIIPSYIAYLFGKDKTGIVKGSLSIYSGILTAGGSVGALLTLVGSFSVSKIFYALSASLVVLLIIDTLGAGFLRGVDFGLLKNKRGIVTGFMFGLLIAFVAAPCVVPLFATTIIVAVTITEGILRLLLIMSYSTGLGLPFMIIGALPWIAKRMKGIEGRRIYVVRILILVGTLIWLVWSLLSI